MRERYASIESMGWPYQPIIMFVVRLKKRRRPWPYSGSCCETAPADV
jgi:hypothetical protein